MEDYVDAAPIDKPCKEWFSRFMNGDCSIEDKSRSGQTENHWG